MIHAIRNSQKATFSDHVWDLLPPGKEGWEQVKPEPPAEVKAAVKVSSPRAGGKGKDAKQPEPPAEVKADAPVAGEESQDLVKGGGEL